MNNKLNISAIIISMEFFLTILLTGFIIKTPNIEVSQSLITYT